MPTTTNRTLWPLTGGAIALQPGWFQGHATAFFYMNLGFGTDGPGGGPPNMSFPMVPVFQIVGPSKNPYPGTFCLPQVPLPANTTVNVGDNATIQVVETAVHGASLFSVCASRPGCERYEHPFCISPSWNGKRFEDQKLTSPKCVDITFADPKDVAEVNETNCFNSSDISFNNVFSIATGSSTSSGSLSRTVSSALLPLAGLALYALL